MVVPGGNFFGLAAMVVFPPVFSPMGSAFTVGLLVSLHSRDLDVKRRVLKVRWGAGKIICMRCRELLLGPLVRPNLGFSVYVPIGMCFFFVNSEL